VKIAVVGATGLVGEALLRVLEERRIPASSVSAFGSRARNGGASFKGKRLDVQPTNAEALQGFDAIFFAGGDEPSAQIVPKVAKNGCVVIDNSAAFRLDPNLSLIVPEVNAAAVRPSQKIFPVGNCTAIIMSVALGPITKAAGLRRLHAATYQAVSGAGRAALEEFEAAERAACSSADDPNPKAFAAPIARNVVPQIGQINEHGYSVEEAKIQAELRKILSLPELESAVMAVRVPVRFAHSAAIFFETERATSRAELAAALKNAAGVVFHEDGIVTPREVEGKDDVHVARLRAEDDPGKHFAMWMCGDQVRKGAATNGVQILELLIERGIVKR